jgi:hypothetical protein
MPYVEATTQDALQTPQASLSLPSLIQPHLAAATASICVGLFAYVARRYVDRRLRKKLVDDGRYSKHDGGATTKAAVELVDLEDRAFARERIAAR